MGRVNGRRVVAGLRPVVFLATALLVLASCARSLPPPVTPSGTTTPPVGPLVSDAFARVVSGGFGTSPVGGAWVVEKGNPADFSTDGTGGVVAVQNAPYTSAEHIAVVPAVAPEDWAATFDVSFLENVKALHPKNGGVIGGVVARFHNASDTGQGYYRLQLVWNANNGSPLLFLRAQDDSGLSPPGHFKVEQDLGIDPTAQFGSPPYTYHVAVQITGNHPTTVALKAWALGSPEPAGWLLTGTDTGNFGPQSPGPVGLRLSADLQGSPGSYLPAVSHVKISNLVVTALP